MSITLNAGQISSLTVGGVTQETNTVCAVTSIAVDYFASTISFNLMMGTPNLIDGCYHF